MTLTMRTPSVVDGAQLWTLIRAIPGLDLNSPYCYFLLAEHFADTCVLADWAGEFAGAVVAYRKPSDPRTLFVWQVAVPAAYRGRGIGRAMLEHLVAAVAPVRVEATVAPSNEASRRMFRSLARAWDAAAEFRPWLAPDHFPEPGHEAEELLRIGPLTHPRAGAPHDGRALDNQARMARS